MLTALLWWIVVGLIAGFLAGVAMRGGGFGIVGDIIVGILGAIIGGFIAGLLGLVPRLLGRNSTREVGPSSRSSMPRRRC